MAIKRDDKCCEIDCGAKCKHAYMDTTIEPDPGCAWGTDLQ